MIHVRDYILWHQKEGRKMEKRQLEKQQSFCNFGHEHPLKNTNSPPKENSFCSACNLKISQGNKLDYFTCKTCPFYLHNVCHNMPKRTQHPSHPNHHLILTLQNSLISKQPLKCEACEGHINNSDYFYSCQECGVCFHTLCSALPLLISVSRHTHQLKLAFKPPYNFSCDICAKPSFDGWLYRCQICEFDSHLICAISNHKPQSFPVVTTHNSSLTSSLGVIGRISVDYRNEVDEVMQLVTEKLRCQSFDNQVINSQEIIAIHADSGCDFRLQSPKENHHYITSPLDRKESDNSGVNIDSPTPVKQFLNQSPLVPVSEETSTVTSIQFSDACFSIDLGRSYSGYDPTKQGKRTSEANNHEDEEQAINKRSNVPEVTHEPKLEKSDFKQKKLQLGSYGNGSSSAYNYSFNMGRDGRLKEAFLVRNDTLTREELGNKVKKGKSSQSTISYKDRSGGSSWQKLICFCNTS